MTLVELGYLLAVANEKHFGRAALASHISQPALSAGIKHLEEELGVVLVERGAGAIRLTVAGEAVASQAQRVVDETERVWAAARQKRAPLSGTLRLGVIATLAPWMIAPVIVPLQRARRELDVVLREGLTAELVALLKLGRLDALLMALPVEGAGLSWEPVFDEPFVALVPSRSPLAARKKLRVADLAAHRLILLSEGHCFRDQALAVCQGHLAFEQPERDQLAATSLHTIWRMVEAGLGCTLLPRLAADDMMRARQSVKVIELAPPVPCRHIGIVWRSGAASTEMARALAVFVRSHVPQGASPVAT